MSDRDDVLVPVQVEAELVIPATMGAAVALPVEVDVSINCDPE